MEKFGKDLEINKNSVKLCQLSNFTWFKLSQTLRGVFVKIMPSHTTKSVLIYSLLIYKYFLKERVNLLGKKSISETVSDETLEVLGPALAMFENKLGRGRGLSHLI